MRLLLAAHIVTLSVTLLPAPGLAQSYYQAVLDGAQETPPNNSPGHGFACFYLDGDGMLYYEISYFGLWGVETRSHIHGPAPPGVSARYLYLLDLGNPKSGAVGPLTPEHIGYLNDSLLYVNIHTPNVSHGEIRGQILPVDGGCTVPVRGTTWGGIKALYRIP
jgi:CHRD domain